MEARRQMAGWVSLVLCVLGLRAEFIDRSKPPVPEFVSIPCVFPFTYHDAIYYSCTSVHSDYAWCSLDAKFTGRWRYCTGRDAPKCTFPFTFKGRSFRRCTKEHYLLNRSWCSLTRNYDKDGKWKQCSPHHL